MTRYELIMLLNRLVPLSFVVAFGSCVGSLINVVVYRMPLGMSIVSPPSRCPACNTLLTWRENIPVFGWLFLRGRCRFCRSQISPEYPLVEAFTGLLFGLFYALWYLAPHGTEFLGVNFGAVKPEWAMSGIAQTWPEFVVLTMLLGSLIAMTIVDAKTTTIPLLLAWFPAAVAVVILPIHAAIVQYFGPGRMIATASSDLVWSIATPGPESWGVVGVGLGGVLGLVVSNVLVKVGWLTRSFDDYEQWERQALQEKGIAVDQQHESEFVEGESDEACNTGASCEQDLGTKRRGVLASVLICAALSLILALIGSWIAKNAGVNGWWGGVLGLVAGPVVGGLLTKNLRRQEGGDDGDSGLSQAEIWIQYPHARREMVRELAFLGPVVLLAYLGAKIAIYYGIYHRNGGGGFADQSILLSEIPLWLRVLTGVFMGFLVGGGVVWAVRILGSIAFGKEAMGLGDVHMMAGVGACLGWIDPVLAFFGASLVGIYLAILGAAWTGRGAKAMPYGPSLAAATVLVLLFKPLIELGLSWLMVGQGPIDLP